MCTSDEAYAGNDPQDDDPMAVQRDDELIEIGRNKCLKDKDTEEPFDMIKYVVDCHLEQDVA